MTQIGKYEVVRRTGETPLGAIYEAFDPVMRRTVSIQAPQECDVQVEPTKRTTSRLALQRGGECLGRLNHPNIRNIIATEESDGTLYLIMEHVDASPVSERLSNGLPAHEALSLLKMAAAGLDHAHSKGVIHPGLGPSHLLVDSTGLLKIAGFEMSSLESFDAGAVSIAEAELLLSSVPYRAPELLFGEIPEGRSDQFSLAAIAFMLLAGDQNSNSDAPILAMADIVSNARFNLAALDTRFNSGVRRVIEKALAFEAAGRYSSCSAFVDALETACLRKSASMTRLATPEESVRVTPQSISLEGNIPGSRPTERPSGNRKKSHFKGRILLIVAFSTVFVLAGILLLLLRRSSTPTVTRTNPASFTPPSSAARAETDLSTHELSNKVKQHPGNQAQIDQSAPPASEDLTTIPPKPKLTRKKAAKAAHPEPKLQGPDIKVPQ